MTATDNPETAIERDQWRKLGDSAFRFESGHGCMNGSRRAGTMIWLWRPLTMCSQGLRGRAQAMNV